MLAFELVLTLGVRLLLYYHTCYILYIIIYYTIISYTILFLSSFHFLLSSSIPIHRSSSLPNHPSSSLPSPPNPLQSSSFPSSPLIPRILVGTSIYLFILSSVHSSSSLLSLPPLHFLPNLSSSFHSILVGTSIYIFIFYKYPTIPE